MTKAITYEESLAQLEEIVRKMNNNEFTIDELTVQVKTARQLIKRCREKLTKTETDLQKISELDD